MDWSDEGYLLSKNNFDENSIIIEVFTLNHGKYAGLVYGGASRKQKKIFQIGNKLFVNLKSKTANKSGYFSVELIEPISPIFFDDKKRSTSILSSTSILKILLPERQINKNIYYSFEKMLNNLHFSNWIQLYIYWELSLIKELGYELDFANLKNAEGKNDYSININNKSYPIPKIILNQQNKNSHTKEIHDGLIFNKHLLVENFITPNRLRYPLFRNMLEKYYS